MPEASRRTTTPLSQFTYTFGARYLIADPSAHFRPFAEAKLGGAHASGSLAPSSTHFGGSNAFALEAGGGLQIRVSPRIAIIPVEANYLFTTLSNGSANRQNDLKLSAGVVFRFKR